MASVTEGEALKITLASKKSSNIDINNSTNNSRETGSLKEKGQGF